jgi:dephospho-CoA kinase
MHVKKGVRLLDKAHPLVIVVGMAGAGKSVISGYLRELGWNLVYFGGVTLAELDARGLAHTPDNEKAMREELRQKHGKDAYAKCCLPKIQECLGQGPTVIDGLYSWAEYLYLKKNITGPMYVWAAFTTRSVRYARLAARPVRPLTPEQALARDIAEIENLDKGGPIAMADFTLVNEGSEEDLRKSIDLTLRRHVR